MSQTPTVPAGRASRSGGRAVGTVELIVRVLLSPLLLRIALAPEGARQSEFQLCSEWLSTWPFRLGMLARRVFYRATLQGCGVNPVIRLGTTFVYPGAELGDNVLIGNRCAIGLATIGDNVLIANDVSVLSGRNHHRRQGVGEQIEDGEVQRVWIGAGAWLGAAAVVMADVGTGAIVGAGAVVVRPVAPGTTVVGNPARVIDGA